MNRGIPMRDQQQVTITAEEIDIEYAEALLATIEEGEQRDLKPSLVAKYARDMASDSWGFCADPIILDAKGRLINGQHRLRGIVQSGRSQNMLVMRNAPSGSIAYMDIGAKRTPADMFDTTGRRSLIAGMPRNTAAGAIAVMMSPAARKGAETRGELLAFADKHAKAIRWTFSVFAEAGTMRYVTLAPVVAAVGRAYYHIPHQVLAAFVRVLVTGVPESIARDKSIITFRNWLISEERKAKNSNARNEIYLKAARVVVAYHRGEQLTKVYAAGSDPFPLPKAEELDAALQFADSH
jgi:hypothetical protein